MMASSPSEDCSSTVVNQNGTTSDAMSFALDQLDTLNMAKVTVECQVCNLKFNTRSVLDCHMAGLKHQKKLKSLELLKSLEPMQSEFERDEVSGVIKCIVCNITVNSPQLLATHMAGNKHKAKAASASKRPLTQEAYGAPPAKRPCNTSQDDATDTAFSEAGIEQTPGADGDLTAVAGDDDGAQRPAASAGGSSKKKKKKKSLGLAGATEGSVTVEEPVNLPDCVTKLVTSSGGTSGYYLCNPCNAHCNSPQQLTQHLTSKKHLDKLRGVARPPGRGRGGRGGWGDNRTRAPWEKGETSFTGRGAARGNRGGRGRGGSSYGMAMESEKEFVGGYRGGRGRGARGGGGMKERGGFMDGGREGSEGGFRGHGRGSTSFRGRGFARGGGSMHYGDDSEGYGAGGDGWYGNETPAHTSHHYGGMGRGRGNPAHEDAAGEEDFLSWQARTQARGVDRGRADGFRGGRGGYGGGRGSYGGEGYSEREPAYGGGDPGYGCRGGGFGAQEGGYGAGGGRGGYKVNGKAALPAVDAYASEGLQYGGDRRYGAVQYAGADEAGAGREGGAAARGGAVVRGAGNYSNPLYKRPTPPVYETGGVEVDKFYNHWNQPPPPPPAAAKGMYDLPGAGLSAAAARPYVGGYPQQQDAASSHGAAYGGHQTSHIFTEPLSENFVHGNIMA